MTMTASELAQRIDHTLLKPEATAEQVDALCDEAIEYGFAGVCVNPIWVEHVGTRLGRARGSLRGASGPAIVSVAGFPLGACETKSKVEQAQCAIDSGATEIDMVIHIGALVAADRAAVSKDVEAVASVVHRRIEGGVLKVILETGALTTEQIILGCRCATEGEADFVKTSTGYHPSGGATVEHVRLLHRYASPILVKASGGIRSAKAAIAMIEAGAKRIGTSSGVAIMNQMLSEIP